MAYKKTSIRALLVSQRQSARALSAPPCIAQHQHLRQMAPVLGVGTHSEDQYQRGGASRPGRHRLQDLRWGAAEAAVGAAQCLVSLLRVAEVRAPLRHGTDKVTM